MNVNNIINKKYYLVYKELIKYLNNIKKEISYSNKFNQIRLLEEMYQTVKEYSLFFYENGQLASFYPLILNCIIECENYYDGVLFKINKEEYQINSFAEITSVNDLLDFIVTNVRNRIVEDYNLENNEKYNFDEIDLTNKCGLISTYVRKECTSYGIKCHIIKINPAFTDKIKLYDGNGYHYFNILEYCNILYLMDLSYSQFFKDDYTKILGRLGIAYLSLCSPGTFMLIDEKRKELASTILNRGWITATGENLKHYFDGFTLSDRNGLYYELLGKIDYTTTYDVDDYFNFLNNRDSLLNYEPEEALGYQKKPLKNPYLNFKK